MLVFDTPETATNIPSCIDHGLRRWVHKLRRWSKFYIVPGRLTWINILGVPVTCWTEQIHTWNKGLIREKLIVKVLGKELEVNVVEEVGDIMEVEWGEEDDDSNGDDTESKEAEDNNDIVMSENESNNDSGEEESDGDVSDGLNNVQVRRATAIELIRKEEQMLLGKRSQRQVTIQKEIWHTGNDKKKAGKRSVTKALVGARQRGVEGSGEHLKGICEAYKEYNEVENEGNEMFIIKGSGRTNSSIRSCSINMEQVKEIGELIGVSWTKAENQRGMGTNVETKKNGREERLKGV
ncbi:hypothetical protein Tco_1356856 [Tanacetum coccineum]